MRRLILSSTRIAKIVSWSGAVALIAALAVWGPAGPAVSSAAATTPTCTTNNLVVWINTSGNGAAGSSYYSINFTNLGKHTCTLEGYPGVSGISTAGIQLGSAAQRDNAHTAKLITLASASTAKGFESATSASTATAIVQITEAENFPAATCGQITSAGLRVYPPGEKVSTVIPYPFVACGKSGPKYLHIEAVQKYVVAGQ